MLKVKLSRGLDRKQLLCQILWIFTIFQLFVFLCLFGMSVAAVIHSPGDVETLRHAGDLNFFHSLWINQRQKKLTLIGTSNSKCDVVFSVLVAVSFTERRRNKLNFSFISIGSKWFSYCRVGSSTISWFWRTWRLWRSRIRRLWTSWLWTSRRLRTSWLWAPRFSSSPWWRLSFLWLNDLLYPQFTPKNHIAQIKKIFKFWIRLIYFFQLVRIHVECRLLLNFNDKSPWFTIFNVVNAQKKKNPNGNWFGGLLHSPFHWAYE